MRLVTTIAIAAALMATACWATPAKAPAQPTGELVSPEPPPADREESPDAADGQVWVAGRWAYLAGAWKWTPGHAEPARDGQEWVAGAWEEHDGAWHWREGAWKPQETREATTAEPAKAEPAKAEPVPAEPVVGRRGRASVAVLGLEVIDDGSGIDTKTIKFAEEMTEALRQRGKMGTGPFTLAPGSDKNLTEMKLLGSCENEAMACMAQIGAELAADYLVFGKVEKRSNGYQLSLKLVNVPRKTFERSLGDIVPFSDASGVALSAWGKKLYSKLGGMTDQGTLIVKANVERGTVYLDGQVKGTVSGGMARIAGLAAGDYKLAIESECYLRWEAKVTIDGGNDTTSTATLERSRVGGCRR